MTKTTDHVGLDPTAPFEEDKTHSVFGDLRPSFKITGLRHGEVQRHA